MISDGSSLIKNTLARYLPASARNKILGPYRYWRANSDLLRLDLIRDASLDELRDPFFLEDIIAELGLYPAQGNWMKDFPKHLWRYCGNGLRIWQYPNQFSKYLAMLADYRISTYLEIGLANGGTFLTTVEYLKMFNPEVKAWGVDPRDSQLVKVYIEANNSCRYIEDFAKNLGRYVDLDDIFFDLVLIDGDHVGEAPLNDFHIIKDRAGLVAFHDIVDGHNLDVSKCWMKIREMYNNDYDFIEFTDQYEEVVRNEGHKLMGIGIAIKKWTRNYL